MVKHDICVETHLLFAATVVHNIEQPPHYDRKNEMKERERKKNITKQQARFLISKLLTRFWIRAVFI